MATTRINVKINSEGIYYLDPSPTNKMWDIRIVNVRDNPKESGVVCISLSKANPDKSNFKKRVTTFPLQEGTLTLVNKTYDWYCYFREKRLQEFCDKYHIVNVTSYKKGDKVYLPYLNGQNQNPIFYLDGFYVDAKLSELEVTEEDKKLQTLELTLIKTGNLAYLIKQGKDAEHCELYLDETNRLEDVYLLKELKQIPDEIIERLNRVVNMGGNTK